MNIYDFLSILATLIGAISLSINVKNTKKINKTKNNNENIKDSTIIQGGNFSIINNGLDEFAVIKIAKDTTIEELEKVIEKINEIEKEAKRGTKITVGKEPPKNPKDGEVFIDTSQAEIIEDDK